MNRVARALRPSAALSQPSDRSQVVEDFAQVSRRSFVRRITGGIAAVALVGQSGGGLPGGAEPPAQAQPAGPSVVEVEGSGHQYTFWVNGQPREIKGLGYNGEYQGLPAEQRRRVYDRDFAQMRRAGIEVVQGWNPAEFDNVLLDAAQRAGLGVVLPIPLPADAAYAELEQQQQLMGEIETAVGLYKDHPALWMWGLGNEVLHGINSSDSPAARDFAQAYVKLADFLNSIDPKHPVFYRDAEDAFIVPLRDAFLESPGPRPWFVYGMNIFTNRIENVLNTWKEYEFDVPLVMSEFGPMSYPAEQRPAGYQWMWGLIRAQPAAVLGGFVYVWYAQGPDPLDPQFGLVHRDGTPTDGSLRAITQMYGGEGDRALRPT